MVKHEQIQAQLQRDGFAAVGKLSDVAFTQLLNFNRHEPLAKGTPFFYSLLNNDYSANKAIQHNHQSVLNSFFEEYFDDYRTITESFLIKPAHTESELLLHQDWCYTDEQKYQAYNVWIPLQDVTEENGALFFLPGSHLWFNTKRSGSLPTGRINSTGTLIHQNLVTLTAKKGDVLLFNPAVFHGSYPNKTAKDRVIVTTTILDKSAPFLYYQKEDENTIAVFDIEDDLFYKSLALLSVGQAPDAKLREHIQYQHVVVTEAMLEEKLRPIV